MNYKSLIFKSILAVSIIFGSFLFNSCDKDEVIKSDEIRETSDIITFNTRQEFNETLDKVLSMNEEELKTYEESKGIKSFGRTCEELYYSIKPEEFKSTEDVKTFVASNSDYLQLIEEENGELTLETQLYNSPYRYFINKDKVFQINKTVYKVFDFGTVSTSITKIDDLKQMNNNNLSAYENDPDFLFSNSTVITPQLKDWSDFCGSGDFDRSTDGRDRTKLTIKVEIKPGKKIRPGVMELEHKAHFIIRPYKRILGIWFWARRTISADINFAVDSYIQDPAEYDEIGGLKAAGIRTKWVRKFYSYYNAGTMAWKLEDDWSFTVLGYDLFGGYIHFGGYDCWADTPSTPPAVLTCNTSIL